MRQGLAQLSQYRVGEDCPSTSLEPWTRSMASTTLCHRQQGHLWLHAGVDAHHLEISGLGLHQEADRRSGCRRRPRCCAHRRGGC